MVYLLCTKRFRIYLSLFALLLLSAVTVLASENPADLDYLAQDLNSQNLNFESHSDHLGSFNSELHLDRCVANWNSNTNASDNFVLCNAQYHDKHISITGNVRITNTEGNISLEINWEKRDSYKLNLILALVRNSRTDHFHGQGTIDAYYKVKVGPQKITVKITGTIQLL